MLYRNPDILPHRAEWNVHFKKPTASYTDLFARMEASGTISTRSLKPDATHYCELTGHATASVLMDTYAHTQDKPRLELTEKIEANFYSQDLTPAAPQPRQNEKPAATKISGKEILEAIRLMDADERRELTRALFA